MFEKGQTINSRYEIVNLIAKGGTSCVYLVLDRHIGRTLAMKAMERDAVGSFYFARSEIEALRRVRYPLIPVIWDAFYDSQNIYIVSEYVKGDSLGKLCKPKGMSRTRSLAIAQHICSALVYLHHMKKPMLYLDLKPDNIIIDENDMPHLIDFGIAGCLADHHIPVGTIGYSPPEQYSKDAKLDPGADIFAFGMTYYTMRSGLVPAQDPQEALNNIAHSKILNQSEITFLTKCCKLSREERYTDANEVLKQIRHIRMIPQRIKKCAELTIITAGIIVAAYYGGIRIHSRISENQSARSLYEAASLHMKDGEYTPEGIRIIKTAIASKVLPKDCEQDFIFEVALNAMFVERDYKTAVQYFSKLDSGSYPAASDYIKICKIQNGFDFDRDNTAVIAGKLFAETIRHRPSVQKYETLIFVAECYENYETNEAEGLSKAIAVIDAAKSELDQKGQDEDLPEKEEFERIYRRLEELSAVKRTRMRVINKKGRRDYEN